ncbi:MAG: aldehyde ferredoxin oxidoreductase N-terminal domain-containing protein [Chloroflexota bacterium]|nr:aldehyde ferredoxin oxidoreductase N-terminal domain-containing protein [Chloroflexota bacterium]
MYRRLLLIDPVTPSWRLETLQVERLEKDPREDYFVLSGETLCQYLLRRDPGTLVIARGPLPFLSGNKASAGYVSPLTGVPHYSFVGGRAAAQLLNLGLDAICFQSANQPTGESSTSNLPIVVVAGRAPDLKVEFKPANALPSGQRSAYYWLLERELDGDKHAGSVFTLGEGAFLGYRSANLAADAIYHAGRGGAGAVFARFAQALVLRGEPMELSEFFSGAPLDLPPQDWERLRGGGKGQGEGAFTRNPNASIAPLLNKHCDRLSRRTGGTITKLFATGADPAGQNTLPASNAQRLGYQLADLGGPRVLKTTRHGQTGCHWCQVDCRHYHWVPANYASDGRDMLLDDFEPTYAIFAMLGLTPAEDTLQSRLDLLADVDQRLILPIEQMGCDVINVGLGLAALFEGVERGIIPEDDVPDFIATKGSGLGNPGSLGVCVDDVSESRTCSGSSRRIPNKLGSPKPQPREIPKSRNPLTSSEQRLEAAVQAVTMLRSGQTTEHPALRAVGDGPQALAERYPPMQEIVFTSGKGTLGNAGHCNALWTFLMPFSRFFGHYVGQYYKIDEELPPPGSDQEAYQACFERVVGRLLRREFFWLLANALSQCAFTFVIFSQDGKGEQLSDDDLLVRILRHYSIHTTRADLEWFAQAFWVQSIDLKCKFGWRPPSAADFPRRIYEPLSLALGHSPEELQVLMNMLICEWKRQAEEVMARFGYEVPWQPRPLPD